MPQPTYSGTNSQGNSYTTYNNGGYSYNNALLLQQLAGLALLLALGQHERLLHAERRQERRRLLVLPELRRRALVQVRCSSSGVRNEAQSPTSWPSESVLHCCDVWWWRRARCPVLGVGGRVRSENSRGLLCPRCVYPVLWTVAW
mmetsp:Transcript_35791/g.118573  ORF Transcript_35791/g.118573 Transcript_35791/m.118573 type:complete len:145 (-) Transcript_35791:47-481(-)